MRHLTTLMALIVAAPMVVVAQDEEKKQEEDPVIRYMVDRLRRSLDLDDEQMEKVTQLLTEARKEQDDKIRDILTSEQNEKFKGLSAATSGRSSRNRGRSSRGGMGNMFGMLRNLNMDTMKEKLELSDDQSEKVEPIVTELSEEIQERMAELREGGWRGMDWQEEMKKFQERMKKFGTDVKEHLNDDQKKKLDELMGGGSGGNGDNGTPTPGSRTRGRSMEDRIKRVVDRLEIEDDETKELFGELIKKILENLDKVRDYGRTARDRVRKMVRNEDASEEDTQKLLEEVRAERTKLQKGLRDARNELREVVSYKQEIRLVELGVLE